MKLKNRKEFLWLIAVSTAVICLVILLFFKTGIFAGAIGKLVNLLMPFIYGAVIAYLLRPVCLFFERLLIRLFDRKGTGKRKGLCRALSIVIGILLMFLVILLLINAVLPELISSISGLLNGLPGAIKDFEKWMESLNTGEQTNELIAGIQTSLNTLYEKLSSFLKSDLLPYLQTLVPSVTSSFMDLLDVLKNFGLGCIISAYLLGSWEKYIAQLKLITYAVFPRKAADWIKKEVKLTDRLFSGFISGKLLDSLIIGIICFVFCCIVNMPYTMLISIIVGVTNIIPFFGPYLGAIPSAILVLTVSPVKCLVFVIFIVVLQQLDGNVIGPAIIGDKLGLSGFWILFAILFFGSLWGIVGMLVGAPLFAVLYDLVREFVTSNLEKKDEGSMLTAYRDKYPRS